MGDDFQLSKGGGPVSFEGEIIDPGATPGDVLTIQDDGSVAAEAGGGSSAWGRASTATYHGSGSPVGVVTPSGAGDLYVDETTPALYQATGGTAEDWQQVGAGSLTTWGDFGTATQHGEGSPVGVRVPDAAGCLYLSDTPPQFWQATGTEETDWVQLAPLVQDVEELYGASVAIGNNDNGNLQWTTEGGTALLDLTDPLNPTTPVAGVYAISVTARPAGPITVNGCFTLFLAIDTDGVDASITQYSPLSATSNSNTPQVTATLVFYSPAGGVVNAVVTNLDGVGSVDYEINGAYVQRLS